MVNTCIVIMIFLYLAMMLFIGFYSNKKGSGESSGDFYLGGRKLGPLVTAMSAEASDMSSWLLMGMPGLAYICGLSEPFWTALGLAIGTYLNWLVVSKRLHRYSVKTESITIPEFFSNRYRDEKKILTCIAAIIIIIFFVPYTASGFKAIGTLFHSLFGYDYHISMIVGAVIVVTYTVVGGFLAVSTTDLIQSIVMSAALIIIVFFGIEYAGGWDAVVSNAKEMDGFLSITQSRTVELVDGNVVTGTNPYGFLTIVSTLAWGLGYFGMPHILLRFMAIKDEKQLKTSRRIGSIWVVIAMSVAVLIGIIGNAVSKNGVVETFYNTGESETIIIKIAEVFAKNGVVFALLAGLIMAGILACTMSTADSQLLAASSSMSQNLLQEFGKIKLSKKVEMIIARGTVIAVALVAMILAWNPESSVFTIVSFAWAGFGATFGPLILFSLFWKRSNMWGALAGMVSGGIMVFVWKFMIRPLGGAWDIYELLPAFIVGSVMIVGVSLLTKAPSEEIVKEFEEVAKNKEA